MGPSAIRQSEGLGADVLEGGLSAAQMNDSAMEFPPMPRTRTTDPRKRAAIYVAVHLINDAVSSSVVNQCPGEARLIAASISNAFQTLLDLDSDDAMKRFEARGALLYVLKCLYCDKSRLGDLLGLLGPADPQRFAQALMDLYAWTVYADPEEARRLLDAYSVENIRRRQRAVMARARARMNVSC